MTKNDLLEVLKGFTEEAIKDVLLPVRVQKEGEAPECRPAEVYKMRLPDSTSAKKKAPYIIHQIVTSKDIQAEGQSPEATLSMRSIFCVYSDDEQEGSLMLLELMERLRISLLRKVLLDGRFQINLEAGVETLVYPDDTAPYFIGEMMTNWIMPTIEREFRQWL